MSSFDNPHLPPPPPRPVQARGRSGCSTALWGAVLAISPILYALITSILGGGDALNEGSGGGTAIWFVIFTFPIGFVIIVIGFVRWVASKGRK